jgi:hypothetical protein
VLAETLTSSAVETLMMDAGVFGALAVEVSHESRAGQRRYGAGVVVWLLPVMRLLLLLMLLLVMSVLIIDMIPKIVVINV